MSRPARRASRGAVLRLGLRLAVGSAGAGRGRALAVVLSTAVASAVLVTVLGVAHAEQVLRPLTYRSPESQRLLLSVVLAVGLPTVVLVATVSRLSARIRERRLAGLRLLGLTPGETRWVAAWEAGATSLVGAVAGVAPAVAGRPLLAGWDPAGRGWTTGTLAAPGWLVASAVLAVAAAAVASALAPTRAAPLDVLARVRSAEARRPGWWRLVPVLAGAAILAGTVLAPPRDTTSGGNAETLAIAAFLSGSVLAGLGVLLVVPAFVRLLADGLVRFAPGPAGTIAGRRLQAMPAGSTRVVATLLLGLFLVTGARYVVGAFEETSQYAAAIRAAEDGPQDLELYVPARTPLADLESTLAAAPNVQAAAPVRLAHARCSRHGPCLQAYVGSCAELAAYSAGTTTGCRDDETAWIGGPPNWPAKAPSGELSWRAGGRATALPTPTSSIGVGDPELLGYDVHVFVPTTLAPRLSTASTEDRWVAWTGPGLGEARELRQTLAEAGVPARVFQSGRAEYEFVVGLRALVWSVAAVILAVGLLAFGVAGVDRAHSRRPELVSVQLLGTPRRTLRVSQWLEALLPLGVGVPLAVGLGALAGSAFLNFDEMSPPTGPVLLLAAVATGCAVLVAALTVLGSCPPVHADQIRRE